jgi:hypothetical protein
VDPLESCELVEQPVVAGSFVGRFRGQLGMAEKPNTPKR